MSIEFWAGTAVAISLVVLQFYFPSRIRGHTLLFFLKRSVNFTSEVMKEVPDLALHYKGRSVEGDLIWISGVLLNAGNKDVGKTIISHFPQIHIVGEAQWLEFSTSASETDVESIIVSSKLVDLKWDILRASNGIEFDALIQSAQPHYIESLRAGHGLSVSSRIENVRIECKGELSLSYSRMRNKLKILRTSFALSSVALVLCLFAFAFLTDYSDIHRWKVAIESAVAIAAVLMAMGSAYCLLRLVDFFRPIRVTDPSLSFFNFLRGKKLIGEHD